MKRVLASLAAMLLVAPSAVAQDAEANAQTKEAPLPLPSVLFDLGGGYAAPPIPLALSMQGYSVGQVLYGDVHFFPLPFRALGFVVRGDATVLSTRRFLGSSAPAIFSATAGPELQTRAGALMFRCSVLGGVRTLGDGVATLVQPRMLANLQADFVFGRASQLPVAGFFAGLDFLPGMGWSIGATVSFAIF